jgi:hypothetical protein
VAGDEDEDTVEQTVVEHRVAEGATGRRWALSIVLIVLGVVAAVGGVLVDQAALIVGGIAMAIVFGLVAAGSSGISFSGGQDGVQASARLPLRHKVLTTVRKRGFPTAGRSPIDPPNDKK